MGGFSFDDLNDKVAIVTGGTGAIGGEIAMSLARCGALVAIVGRDTEKNRLTAERIKSETGTQAVGVAADVMNNDNLLQSLEDVQEKLGAVNILVNCAGGK